MNTVSETLRDLRSRGYTEHVVPMPGGRVSTPTGVLNAADLDIDERHRFEGSSDPGDECLVLAATWTDHGAYHHGTVTVGYGPGASKVDADLLQAITATPTPYARVRDLERLRDEVTATVNDAGKQLDETFMAAERRWAEVAPRLQAAAATSADKLEHAANDLIEEVGATWLRLRDALSK